jgi:hypothetical protein
MNRFLVIFLSFLSFSHYAQTDSLFPNYNSSFYPSILQAAKEIAIPFLVQQKYVSVAGVTVVDSTIMYKGVSYQIHDYYFNPGTGYYVSSTQYANYDITDFSSIWPTQFPNILLDTTTNSFNSKSDCVGYLTRLLSATGNITTNGNAYLNIINTVHNGNTSHFAAKGYVSTAYSFAVAFPTFPATVSSGWQYVSGTVESSEIDSYNHTIQSSLGTYNGLRKGGFAQSLPGDILAFGYSAASSSNGHVMVMETSPQLLSSNNLSNYFPAQTLAQAKALLSRYNIYSVPVFDCSGQMAHFRDSRKQMSGIGHGTLIMLTDITDDAPTAYEFDSSQVTSSTLHMDTLGTSVYAISVGRFVTGSVTAIQNMESNNAFEVYPNPNNGSFIIEPNNNAKQTIQVYDISGKMVLNQIITGKTNIDARNLNEGIYTISILSKDAVLTKRLVIVK